MFDQREAARIVRRAVPELSETPTATASALLTPIDKFYRRNHFPEVPRVNGDWTIALHGPGGALASVSSSDWPDLPSTTVTTVLECAGNGGSGAHLKRGGFGVAAWRGVTVREVLAGLGTMSGSYVTFRGRDRGVDPDETEEVDHYERSIPLEVALERAVLATHMNGSPLPPDHGYPVRLVIPGWYGSDWIKWVDSITVTDHASEDVYSRDRYRRYQTEDGRSYGPMTRQVAVKSVLAAPAMDELVVGGTVDACGLAWTGTGAVTVVEIRLDDGPWQPVDVVEEADGGALVRWVGRLEAVRPGRHVVACRASDSAGNVQPDLPHGRMYEANHVLDTPVYCI
jgi:DMSO/TMAO reductase YedYZ molybdopterin-dependent catalytic subunit